MQSRMSLVHHWFFRLVPGVALALITVLASGLAAESGAQQSDDRLTVIGCIKRSAADIPSSPGVTAIMSGQTQYVLTKITLSGKNVRPTGGAISPAAIIAEAVNMYRLDDAADAQIAPHVNERVEVTGVLAREPEVPIGTAGRSESNSAVAKGPLLKIESLSTIAIDAESCRD